MISISFNNVNSKHLLTELLGKRSILALIICHWNFWLWKHVIFLLACLLYELVHFWILHHTELSSVHVKCLSSFSLTCILMVTEVSPAKACSFGYQWWKISEWGWWSSNGMCFNPGAFFTICTFYFFLLWIETEKNFIFKIHYSSSVRYEYHALCKFIDLKF
jgi:hypothetical protein